MKHKSHLESEKATYQDVYLFAQMTKSLSILLVLVSTSPLLAQTNYVANSPASNTPGSFNSLISVTAGNARMTGDRNTITGFAAGKSMTSGVHNSFYGVDEGKANVLGEENTFVGFEARLSTTGVRNTFLEKSAGRDNTSGNRNVSTGIGAGQLNTTGFSNLLASHSTYSSPGEKRPYTCLNVSTFLP